jgi:glutathione S-transferase
MARRARPRLAVAVDLTLYTTAASPPCEAVKAALAIKAVPYREVELPPGPHRLHQRIRFGRPTVPALILDGAKIQGSRAIVRSIDRLVPSPPLFPADSDDRAAVEVAERWGDEFLQGAVRRIEIAALRRCPGFRSSQAKASRWKLPEPLLEGVAPPLTSWLVRAHGADDATVERDLWTLPGYLDGVDRLIAHGVIGNAEPNAADLQIGSSVRLLATLADLAPLLAGRPAHALARRLFPEYPGRCPAGVLSVAEPVAG